MSNLKIKYVLVAALGVVVFVVGWYRWGLPGGNLTFLNESNFPQFTAQFDASVGNQRVLLLLSPT